MKKLWKEIYDSYFPGDNSRHKEGEKMLLKWRERANLDDGRTILSTEEKKRFTVKTSGGDIPFNYICDRVDKLEDGTIEVVDYKTVSMPVQPEDLKTKIQARCYAVAMMMEHKGITGVWVTFDLIRFDSVSVYFTREECIETWKYIRELAEQILADDGTTETLNPECRFCVRKTVCKKLRKHINGGGALSVSDIEEAIAQRAELDAAKGAITGMMTDLDRFILQHAEKEEWYEKESGSVQVEITSRGSRAIDDGMAARVIGPDLMSKYGKLGITTVDQILKSGELTSDQASQLRQLITKNYSSPSVKTKPTTKFKKD